MFKQIQRVTPSDVMDIANQMIDESKIAVSVLGPVNKDVLGDVFQYGQ
jgi:predicted Zn-dependent peptidase